MIPELTFDAVAEAAPGPAWRARWDRSWPAYRAWFEARGGRDGPDRATAEAALARHMPELAPIHARLTELAGGSDLAARFLATWCPPPYLAGCSLAALSRDGETRLLRNYDLSPDLNEGLLLRTEWRRPVMGMVEFLWGLSDGLNADGLAIALAFGGTRRVAPGFGICTILRYVLETCSDTEAALAVLDRVPSHMDYNLVLADATGRVASVEMQAGGGARERHPAIATNHQLGAPLPDRAAITRTVERRAELSRIALAGDPGEATLERFRAPPLRQTDYAGGFGTLFTAAYDPKRLSLRLLWPEAEMAQSLADFTPQSRTIRYVPEGGQAGEDPQAALDPADLIAAVPASRQDDARRWLAEAEAGRTDWVAFGLLFVEAPDRAEPPVRAA